MIINLVKAIEPEYYERSKKWKYKVNDHNLKRRLAISKRKVNKIPKDICEELKQVKGEVLFPVTYNAVKLWINKMCAREDMKMTLHTLRHTYATRLEEAGIPAKVKQYLLGHSSLEMTQNTYTDAQESYVDSLSDKVRAVF